MRPSLRRIKKLPAKLADSLYYRHTELKLTLRVPTTRHFSEAERSYQQPESLFPPNRSYRARPVMISSIIFCAIAS